MLAIFICSSPFFLVEPASVVVTVTRAGNDEEDGIAAWEISGCLPLIGFSRDRRRSLSAEAELGDNALTRQQFGDQTKGDSEHGQAAIPGLGEVHEPQARCIVGHWRSTLTISI